MRWLVIKEKREVAVNSDDEGRKRKEEEIRGVKWNVIDRHW